MKEMSFVLIMNRCQDAALLRACGLRLVEWHAAGRVVVATACKMFLYEYWEASVSVKSDPVREVKTVRK